MGDAKSNNVDKYNLLRSDKVVECGVNHQCNRYEVPISISRYLFISSE